MKLRGKSELVVGRCPASLCNPIVKELKNNYVLFLIAIPGILFYILFAYMPIYGAIIAFKDYSPGLGIMGSPWVGLKHFKDFFSDVYFGRAVKNTIILNFYLIVFGFPAPVILALLLNELKLKHFKRTVQTISYMPHFISMVVICGMIVDFTSSKGVLTNLLHSLGFDYGNLLQEANLFRGIYVISDIWQSIGWGSIIYLAALSGIDAQLYEAAEIDGAGKLKQLMHVTLPGIIPTFIIMLIMRVGGIMSLGADKVILLYNPVTYETADVISSLVYRRGLIESDQSFATAVGLFNSVINFALVYMTNLISRKLSGSSLW